MTSGRLRTLALSGKDRLTEAEALDRLSSLADLHEVKAHVFEMAQLLTRAHFLDVARCPCCGRQPLYVGPMSALSYGVHCVHVEDGSGGWLGCGLKVEQEISDQIGDWDALRLAVNTWNRRTP